MLPAEWNRHLAVLVRILETGVRMVSATTANALFAIFGVSNPAALEARLQNISPWLSLKLQEGEWLLIAPTSTTTKEVSDRLGITGQSETVSPAIVIRADGYFGRSAPSNWEWIATKLGVPLATTTV